MGSQTLLPSTPGIRMAYSTRWVLPGMVATLVSYCSGARISSRIAPSWISPRMPRVLTPESTCFSPPTSAARLCISPKPLYTCSSWSLTALKLSVTRFCSASCNCSSTVWRISSSFWAFCACMAARPSASALRISSSLRALEASSPCSRCSMVCCWVFCPAVRVLLIPCTAVCRVSLMCAIAARFCCACCACFSSNTRACASNCWRSHSFSASSSCRAAGLPVRYSKSACNRQMATSKSVYSPAKNPIDILL